MEQSESAGILTDRLSLAPVCADDFEDLAAFKSDPQSFSNMLGGLRTASETQEELAMDQLFWKQHGAGMFTVRLRYESLTAKGKFVGIAGVHQRPDWPGFALRFAIAPPFRGKGMGKEAASATLNFLFQAGISPIIAVVREDNLPSRFILESVGMSVRGIFMRKNVPMWLYEAVMPLKSIFKKGRF